MHFLTCIMNVCCFKWVSHIFMSERDSIFTLFFPFFVAIIAVFVIFFLFYTYLKELWEIKMYLFTLNISHFFLKVFVFCSPCFSVSYSLKQNFALVSSLWLACLQLSVWFWRVKVVRQIELLWTIKYSSCESEKKILLHQYFMESGHIH